MNKKQISNKRKWNKFVEDSWGVLKGITMILLVFFNLSALIMIPYFAITGFHNADLAFNMHRIDIFYNTDITTTACDVLLDGSDCITYDEAYRLGMTQIILAAMHGAITILIDSLIFFIWFFFIREEKTK